MHHRERDDMTDPTTAVEEKNDTEEMVVAMRAVVILGGIEHTVKVKTIDETLDFRTKIGEIFGGVFGPLAAAGGSVTPESIARAMEQMMPSLLGKSFDAFLGLVVAYEPDLAKPFEEATEDERIDAAVEVLRLALPLVDKILNQVKRVRALLKEGGMSL